MDMGKHGIWRYITQDPGNYHLVWNNPKQKTIIKAFYCDFNFITWLFVLINTDILLTVYTDRYELIGINWDKNDIPLIFIREFTLQDNESVEFKGG